jgi:hypothetical protein
MPRFPGDNRAGEEVLNIRKLHAEVELRLIRIFDVCNQQENPGGIHTGYSGQSRTS